MMTARNEGLEVRDLRKSFVIGGGLLRRAAATIRAVNGVSFRVAPGESLGLVGESGCGKSTIARSILRLMELDAGSVTFDGIDVRAASRVVLRQLRQRMQIVFQDPYSSLNPRRTVRQALEEPLRVHRRGSSREIAEKAQAAIAEVGLPKDVVDRYPHEFSGGQRQRIGIARALVLDPDLIIADEPVSALDVSVQAQILRLLEGLRARRRLSFLFVSHDLGVVRHFCDRLAVMYLGRIVEEGRTADVLDRPMHPYTRLLRDSSPLPDPGARIALPAFAGEAPSPAAPPPGCPFHPRCDRADPKCREELPAIRSLAENRLGACHHPMTASCEHTAASS
ncbi:MAG TPA: oligopeptide/dipeptide ABC transporter ATP-binding protein [Xanthobacteraceae bacterium]|nr:oligopeptide/dipeptide ABC transporter ATP-binding protein [Xanthobacteraceae bacterium]